ncbi:hypothetical protein RHRU231_450089 [Rhodococcus ruber]|uniref:Uncharacterized protein n=1 Tax=Rhodococcus ruber TaxID=1830 RepID=A0A098BL39_9NOCA|nr:hypothetical protein RHRU231_450089 [Rhodococcus ruber]
MPVKLAMTAREVGSIFSPGYPFEHELAVSYIR